MKVASLVGGMVAGADLIEDMALLRHGGMGRVFARAYAPSTLGAFLRAFTFGHVRLCPNSLNKTAEPSRTTITFTQS